MKRFSIVLGCVAVVFLALALEAGSPADIEEAPITWRQLALGDGEALYGEFCAVCHGLDAKGSGPAAAALATPVPDLTLMAHGNGGEFPTEEVWKAITGETSIVAHGSQEMPMWGDVFSSVRPDKKPAQREAIARLRIFDLTSYLESLQTTAD